jgi:hypothetical protein
MRNSEVRWFGILLVGCLVLMALKFAVIALALALAITVLWGAFAHPAETLGTLIFFLVAQIAMTHAAASLAVVTILGTCFILRRPDVRKEVAPDSAAEANDASRGALADPVDKE